MSRNLLPSFRQRPNPASIPQAPVGTWSTISVPGDLAKLDYGAEQRNQFRSRVQSIPSPWGRMLLFKNALESELHPARELVEQEILDGLEFLWSIDSLTGVTPRTVRIGIGELESQATAVGSERVEDLARALTTLIPRRSVGGTSRDVPAFESLVVVLVDGQPVLASSPYTMLFTAEDAASDRTGTFFRYSQSAPIRRLKDRQRAFQEYIASVILPQLVATTTVDEQNVDWGSVKRLVKPWLESEVRACGLPLPTDASWKAAASTQRLADVGQPFGGVTLYRRERGAEVDTSRWRLRSGRGNDARAPLIIVPGVFDGRFYEGAPAVTLHSDGKGLDRNVLPQLGIQHPWVNPEMDWLTDRILLLEQPVERENVYGLKQFSSHYQGDDPRLRRPQLALPLRRELFEHFAPEALDEILKIEIRDSGEVEVSLTLQLGPDGKERPVVVRKVYDSSKVHAATGPALAMWPSFRDDRWHDYAIFRRDASADVGRFLELSVSTKGVEIPTDQERRSDRVQVLGLQEAPEVLELRSLVRGTGESAEDLGVVLPRYRPLEADTPATWHVGIDFGTSNTVVSVRDGSKQAGEEFDSRKLLLSITKQDDEIRRMQDGYFFPSEIQPGPFGTAVVHFRRLPNFTVGSDRVGVRVNIPFTGHVEGDEVNAVRGDLKWSSEQHSHFLTASFLRHLLAVVVAQGLQHGVDPSRIHVSWAYPRAFTPAQRNQLAQLWRLVRESFERSGLAIAELNEPIDESRAALRYFFNASQIAVAGQATAILDVGGGTSDIAIYGNGSALVLDSVMLGGRNLTGQREAGAAASHLRNPFVHALWQWAERTQLQNYAAEHRALRKYLTDGQDHLAFSYLLGTSWFRQNGQLFTGQPAFYDFQALVLYFYGSLFFYLGLSFRDLARRSNDAVVLPYSVLVAGNGSRYLHWLTDMSESLGDNPFHEALARILMRGAGVDPDESGLPVPLVRLSEHPKREVALGLVAPVDPQLKEAGAVAAPLVGEAVEVRGAAGQSRSHESLSRLREEDIIHVSEVAQLQWIGDTLEVERFHRALLQEASTVVGYGKQWPKLVQRLEKFLQAHGAREIQQATRGKLQYVAAANEGFRGSLFGLEAACVLELMLGDLFGRAVPSYAPSAGTSTVTAS